MRQPRTHQRLATLVLLAAGACGGEDAITCDSMLRTYSGITMDRTVDFPYASVDRKHVDVTVNGHWQAVDADSGGFVAVPQGGGTLTLGAASGGRVALHLELNGVGEMTRLTISVRLHSSTSDATATADGTLGFQVGECHSTPDGTTM